MTPIENLRGQIRLKGQTMPKVVRLKRVVVTIMKMIDQLADDPKLMIPVGRLEPTAKIGLNTTDQVVANQIVKKRNRGRFRAKM